jgi:plastocyanin
MTANFSITGPAALLAVAACKENNDESVTFAFESLFHSYAFDPNYRAAPEAIASGNLRVEVQRTFSKPGTHRYHCTIHQDATRPVVVQ